MKYNNTVIKVKNPEHGAKVIKWWQNQGVNTKNYVGNYDGRYYGIIDNNFVCYTLAQVQSANATIIELPNELPQRGDIIFVWDDNENNAKERIFLAYIEGLVNPVITVCNGFESDFKNNKPFLSLIWKHWKPIPKEDIVEDVSNTKFVKKQILQAQINVLNIIQQPNGEVMLGYKINNKIEELQKELKQLQDENKGN
jgi:hypothetical protein